MQIVKETEVRGTGKRRILYGHIVEYDNGAKAYFAKRKHAEIFRSGKSSISAAMAEETAAWAIDENTIMSMRAKGCKFIGVRVVDTGDVYLTRIDTWFDRKKFKLRDYTGVGRGGSRQRYVPLQHFQVHKAPTQINATSP